MLFRSKAEERDFRAANGQRRGRYVSTTRLSRPDVLDATVLDHPGFHNPPRGLLHDVASMARLAEYRQTIFFDFSYRNRR